VPKPYLPANTIEFTNGVPLEFGPFRITPHLVDHSAYDACALEVEADGRRLFYSGDIRAHGRKGALFGGRKPRNRDRRLPISEAKTYQKATHELSSKN
jgi:mRNA degradation ribonuclease J1/J2